MFYWPLMRALYALRNFLVLEFLDRLAKLRVRVVVVWLRVVVPRKAAGCGISCLYLFLGLVLCP
jgi:hypothetical protein